MSRLVSQVLAKIRRIKRLQWIATALLISAVLLACLVFAFQVTWTTALLIAAALVVIAACLAGRGIPSERQVLADIGEQNPKLKYLLATAHQAEKEATPDYLSRQVIQDAVRAAIDKKVAANHSAGYLQKLQRMALLALALFIVSLGVCIKYRPGSTITVANEEEPPAEALTVDMQIIVNPGDVEVERESRLVVTALFPESIPDHATLVVDCLDGKFLRRLPMKKKLEDPEFGVTIESVPGDGTYRIETAKGHKSSEYQITTFELPKLVRSDAKVIPPSGSDRKPQLTEDTYLARVFEGDAVEWTLECNKPITAGKLIAKDGTEIPLIIDPAKPNRIAIKTQPPKSERYELILSDAEGRENRNPPYLSILVKENRPAVVKLKFPSLDTRVTPIQEITPEATIIDDLGLKTAGVTYRFDGKVEEVHFELPKPEEEQALRKHDLKWPLDFETLGARPNTLLTYHFWAEDQGPDASNRRTESEMYFIEVRHFEEIFREGPAKVKADGQPNAQKCLDLQKELINATWKVERTSPEIEALKQDGTSLAAMQQYIIELIDEKLLLIKDEVLKSIYQDARQAMVEAQATLEKVAAGERDQLDPSMDHEQTAYERLMNALGREIRMVKAGEGVPEAKRQKKQAMNLKFSQKDRRYEMQRPAGPELKPMDEELAMHFKRMLDLAKRQEAITDQLQQLLASLEAATTPEEKEEIEHKLKRLREEQREMLTEIDKMLEKMDRMGKSEQLAETMAALEKARKQATETSKAMSEKNLAKATTASKRAEEQMRESTEEMRKANASQFAAHMQELREAANKLAEEQNKLTESLANQAQKGSKAAASKSQRDQHEKAIRQQQKELTDVLEKMRDITRASEEQEPLLSRQLYQAIRNVETQGTTESLDEAAKEVRRGAYAKASETEAKAAENIDQLQKEIDTAADSVIGSEAEALKRADRQLAQLIEELNKENRSAQTGKPNQPGSSSKIEDLSGEQELAQAGEGQSKGTETNQENAQGKGEAEGKEGEQNPGSKGRGEEKGKGKGKGGELAEKTASKGDGKGQGKGSKGAKGQEKGKEGTLAAGKGGTKGEGKGQGKGGKGAKGQGQGQKGSQAANSSSDSKNKGEGESEGEAEGEGKAKAKGSPGTPTSSSALSTSAQGEFTNNQQDDQHDNQPTTEKSDATITGGSRQHSSGTNRQLSLPTGRRKASFLDAFDEDTPIDHGDDRPITGEEYNRWAEMLKEVEIMLGDADLKREATRIRLRSREYRSDFKRHSRPPEWSVVETGLVQPLRRLRTNVKEEIARQEDDADQQVRIDRDPAPTAYKDLVEKYYQKLGSTQAN